MNKHEFLTAVVRKVGREFKTMPRDGGYAIRNFDLEDDVITFNVEYKAPRDFLDSFEIDANDIEGEIEDLKHSTAQLELPHYFENNRMYRFERWFFELMREEGIDFTNIHFEVTDITNWNAVVRRKVREDALQAA